jgi:pectate lyase
VSVSDLASLGSNLVADAATSLSISDSAGYEEGAYVEWTGSTSDEYSVYYKKGSGSYVQIDSMLIRQYSGYFRADAVGLSAGSYTLKVVGKSSGEVETKTLTVTAYDRSGFAFSKNSPTGGEGVGAYNYDGTLKSNAQVLYVTEDTKTTVTMDIGGKTYTGIANITQQAKKASVPICIRIVGTVTFDDLSSSDMSSAYALGVKEASNVTIEGIGEDATLYGAGLAAFKCNSVEFRNLGLMLWGGGKDGDGITLKQSVNVWVHNNDIFYGEAGSDSDQAKGDGSMDLKDNSQYITISYNHFWDSGKMSLCGMKSESGENWITYHHNWFDHSDSRHPRIRTMSVHVYNNYYDGNSKYGVGTTLGSSAFVEANYFRNCKYPMLISLQGSDTIAEGVFSGEKGGMIKSYGNYIEGAKSYITYQKSSTDFDAYEASSRDEKVPSTVTNTSGYTYNNFDTDSSIMYDYTVDKAEDVKDIVTSKAGRLNGGDFKFEFDDSVDDESYTVNTELMSKLLSYQSSVVAIGSGNFTSETPVVTTTATTTTKTTDASASTTKATASSTATGTSGTVSGQVYNFTTDTSSTYYTVSGKMNSKDGSATYGDLTLTKRLKLETATSITFTSTSDATLTLVTDTATYVYLDGNKVTLDGSGITEIAISAGAHELKKGNTGNLYLIAVSDSGEQPAVTTTPEQTSVSDGSGSTQSTSDSASGSVTTSVSTQTPSVVADAIYCSPDGTGDGSSIDSPTNVLDAIASVKAGGYIYLLDGTYSFDTTILIDDTNNGTTDAYKTITAYPGATVVWDFSAMEVNASNRGVVLDGDYWHFYGFEITKAGDNGMLLSGSNNVIEMMVFSSNQDTGLQISRYKTTNATIETWPSDNLILNCTSKNNCDDATMENADGFAAKLTCGEGNVFDGCMSYNNSDDGWDLFAKSATGPIGVVTIQNCIAFRNGYTEDGRGYGDCDGNGFKLGGSGVGSAHVVKNCLSFENLHCGFTDNNNPKLESLTDCTAFNNDVGADGKPNFSVYRCTDDGCDFSGILSYLNDGAKKLNNDKFVGTITNSVYYNGKKYYSVADKVDIDNGDKTGTVVSLSDSDFVSVTAPEMGTDFHTAWRDADGSINVHGFMQLADASEFTELGASFDGYLSAKNPAEFDASTVVTNPAVSDTVDSSVSESSAEVSDTTSISEVTDASGSVVGSVVVTEPTNQASDTTSISEVTDASGSVVGSVVVTEPTAQASDTTSISEVTDASGSVVGSVVVTDTTTDTSDGGDTSEGTLYGDVNCDGKVDGRDLLALKKYSLGLVDELSEQALQNADVTHDGSVDGRDLLKLKKYSLGLIDALD